MPRKVGLTYCRRLPRPRKVTPKIQEMVDVFETPDPVPESPESPVPRMDDSSSPQNQSDGEPFEGERYLNLDKCFPRIPMTSSMLQAYASIRGKCDREGDPVHYNLYTVRERNPGTLPVWISTMRERRSMEGLPQGTVLFWDPLIRKPPSPPSSPVQEQDLIPDFLKPLTFIEHLQQFPNNVGKNHYKRDQVYENFGYIHDKDTNQWIDPDAPGLLKDEYISGHRGENDDEGHNDAFDFERSQRSGPRIMSREEQDEFYSDYTEYVSDGEGDPRNHRITPTTFTRWAEGARKGRGYEEEAYKPENHVWSKKVVPYGETQKKQAETNFPPLYDVYTGEYFDNFHEEDENPAMMIEPEGVDIVKMPGEFQRCQPALTHKFTHLGYGGSLVLKNEAAKEAYPQPLSTNYSSKVYKDYAISNLGDPKDPGSGAAEHRSIEIKLISLRHKFQEDNKKLCLIDKKVSKKTAHKVDHERDVFFLKLHKGEDPTTYKPRPEEMVPPGLGYYQLESSSSEVTPLTPSELSFEEVPDATATAGQNGAKVKVPKSKFTKYVLDPVEGEALDKLLAEPPPCRQPTNKYQKYFSEEYEHRIVQKNHMDVLNAMRNNDYLEIKKGIAEARAEKDALVQSYGVYRMEDIPGLWAPRPHEEPERAEHAIDRARGQARGKGRVVEAEGVVIHSPLGVCGGENALGLQVDGPYEGEEQDDSAALARRQEKGKGRDTGEGVWW